VVTAQDEEVLGVLDLVCEEQADGLERLLATVYVVAQEEVVGLRWETAILEQAEQIVVLAVDVTADLAESCQHFLPTCASALQWCRFCTDLYRRLKLEQNGL
jgi:hypothetical protein